MIQVISSFDDGSTYDLKTADLLTKYNIQSTFFIPVNWRKYNATKGVAPLTQDELYDIASQFQIGSHGIDHLLLTRVSDSEQNREILDSLKYWKNNGFRVESFCYPRGYYTTEIKQKVKDSGYKWARTVRIGELSPAQDPYETHTTVHVYDRKEYGTDWLTYARKMIKEAIKRAYAGENIDYSIFGHSEEINRYDQWDRFEQLLKELSAL